MSQAKPTVAPPSAVQFTEQPKCDSSRAIGRIYSSTSPKIRELKERYEASHATEPIPDMTKLYIRESGMPDSMTEDGKLRIAASA